MLMRFCLLHSLLMFLVFRRSSTVHVDEDDEDVEHEVISLKTQNVFLMSVIKMDLCERMFTSKFQHFIVILCAYPTNSSDRSQALRSYIRIYEDQNPFDLLMIIDTDEIRVGIIPFQFLSNIASQSFFIAHSYSGIWKLRWEDQSVERFLCSPKKFIQVDSMSFSREGHLMIFDFWNERSQLICDTNGRFIREMPITHKTYYTLETPIGQYTYSVFYSDTFTTLQSFIFVHVTFNELNDFDVSSDAKGNRTTECNATTFTRSIFLPNVFPKNIRALEVQKLTIERRYKDCERFQNDSSKYSGLSSADENHFEYLYDCNGAYSVDGCLFPNASSSHHARETRERIGVKPYHSLELQWRISYYYDRLQNQLIVSITPNLPTDSINELFILLLT